MLTDAQIAALCEGSSDKLERLRQALKAHGSALVAFSGGVDSAFVLKVALDELGDKAVALTALSPSVSPDEAAEAKTTSIIGLARQRALLIFAGSVLLLQLANAAMLPLMAGVVTARSSQWAPVLIAATVCTVSTSAVMVSSAVTDPVTILRSAMSSHTTAVPATRPASGLTRSVTAT